MCFSNMSADDASHSLLNYRLALGRSTIYRPPPPSSSASRFFFNRYFFSDMGIFCPLVLRRDSEPLLFGAPWRLMLTVFQIFLIIYLANISIYFISLFISWLIRLYTIEKRSLLAAAHFQWHDIYTATRCVAQNSLFPSSQCSEYNRQRGQYPSRLGVKETLLIGFASRRFELVILISSNRRRVNFILLI